MFLHFFNLIPYLMTKDRKRKWQEIFIHETDILLNSTWTTKVCLLLMSNLWIIHSPIYHKWSRQIFAKLPTLHSVKSDQSLPILQELPEGLDQDVFLCTMHKPSVNLKTILLSSISTTKNDTKNKYYKIECNKRSSSFDALSCRVDIGIFRK